MSAPTVRVPQVVAVGQRALLLEYVPAVDLPATEEAGECVGAYAAAIHSHRFEVSGLLSEALEVDEPFSSAIAGLTAWLETVLQEAPQSERGALKAARQLWDLNASWLESISSTPVLLHADFKPANIKWSPGEKRAVVFDWEFAWAGPSLFDLGQLFRWNPQPAFRDGFETGYLAAGGRLPDGWLHGAELFDLLNLANLLSRDVADPVRQRDVRRRIAETIARHQG